MYVLPPPAVLSLHPFRSRYPLYLSLSLHLSLFLRLIHDKPLIDALVN